MPRKRSLCLVDAPAKPTLAELDLEATRAWLPTMPEFALSRISCAVRSLHVLGTLCARCGTEGTGAPPQTKSKP